MIFIPLSNAHVILIRTLIGKVDFLPFYSFALRQENKYMPCFKVAQSLMKVPEFSLQSSEPHSRPGDIIHSITTTK